MTTGTSSQVELDAVVAKLNDFAHGLSSREQEALAAILVNAKAETSEEVSGYGIGDWHVKDCTVSVGVSREGPSLTVSCTVAPPPPPPPPPPGAGA